MAISRMRLRAMSTAREWTLVAVAKVVETSISARLGLHVQEGRKRARLEAWRAATKAKVIMAMVCEDVVVVAGRSMVPRRARLLSALERSVRQGSMRVNRDCPGQCIQPLVAQLAWLSRRREKRARLTVLLLYLARKFPTMAHRKR